MRLDPFLESYRIVAGQLASKPGAPYGAFDNVPGPCGDKLYIIIDDGERTGWEHVSVSKKRHPPNWAEMCWVKDLCWHDEDIVLQFHPSKSHYINNFSKCLHMWRQVGAKQAMPPEILVGYKELGELA